MVVGAGKRPTTLDIIWVGGKIAIPLTASTVAICTRPVVMDRFALTTTFRFIATILARVNWFWISVPACLS